MTTSYNGWVASPNAASIGVAPFSVNGVSFPSGVKSGDVAVVFTHLVQQYAARVEPLLNPGCWGYFYKNSANSAALLSCHSSGTAIDLNAPKHPNGRKGSFSAAQVAQIRAILAELGGVVYWGGDSWGNGTTDEMHFEIREGVTVAQVAAVAAKLRGGSTPVVPTPPAGDPNSLPTLSYGQTTAVIADLQRFCNAYPFKPALPLLPVTGFYGDQTAAVLHAAGRQFGVAGDIDGKTFGPHFKAAFWAHGFRG